MTAAALVLDVIKECERLDIEVRFRPSAVPTIDGDKVAGVFERMRLCVDTTGDSWVTTLAHEFGHVTQYRDDRLNAFVHADAYRRMCRWLAGRDYPDAEVQAFMRCVMEFEVDAERVAVWLCGHYRVPVDLGDYRARANAYIFSHLLAARRRSMDEDAYSDAVIALMPRDRIVDHTEQPPPGYWEVLVGPGGSDAAEAES